MRIWFAPKVYHKREGYAVGKVQFSDFENDSQVRCTKLTLVLPLAVQEMVMGLWLIIKGFSPDAVKELDGAHPLNVRF